MDEIEVDKEVFSDILDIFKELSKNCEKNEDSLGNTFFSVELNEDSFFILKNKLEKLFFE